MRPLIGGTSPNEGVLEVCYEGEYLPVSLTGLTIAETNVVCRQLNLSTGNASHWQSCYSLISSALAAAWSVLGVHMDTCLGSILWWLAI